MVFSKHDVNKDGYITTRELAAALKDLHLPTDTSQAVSTLHEFDKDSDGRLDLPEFALLLRKLRALQGSTPPPPPPHCARPSAPTTRAASDRSR